MVFLVALAKVVIQAILRVDRWCVTTYATAAFAKVMTMFGPIPRLATKSGQRERRMKTCVVRVAHLEAAVRRAAFLRKHTNSVLPARPPTLRTGVVLASAFARILLGAPVLARDTWAVHFRTQCERHLYVAEGRVSWGTREECEKSGGSPQALVRAPAVLDGELSQQLCTATSDSRSVRAHLDASSASIDDDLHLRTIERDARAGEFTHFAGHDQLGMVLGALRGVARAGPSARKANGGADHGTRDDG